MFKFSPVLRNAWQKGNFLFPFLINGKNSLTSLILHVQRYYHNPLSCFHVSFINTMFSSFIIYENYTGKLVEIILHSYITSRYDEQGQLKIFTLGWQIIVC